MVNYFLFCILVCFFETDSKFNYRKGKPDSIDSLVQSSSDIMPYISSLITHPFLHLSHYLRHTTVSSMTKPTPGNEKELISKYFMSAWVWESGQARKPNKVAFQTGGIPKLGLSPLCHDLAASASASVPVIKRLDTFRPSAAASLGSINRHPSSLLQERPPVPTNWLKKDSLLTVKPRPG